MQISVQVTRAILLACCVVGFSGCGGESATTDTADSHADHDHGDAVQIDASAAGLNADDLISLNEKPIPDNLDDAVAELSKLSKTIADSINSGDIHDDHGPLHDVAGLLDGIKALAEKSSMKDDAKKAIASATDQLMDAYMDVDYRLHDSKKGKDYADVSDQIQKALATLESYAK